MQSPAPIWNVLRMLEQNLELIPTPALPQVSINLAIFELTNWHFLTLTRDGPQLTQAGRLYVRAIAGR